MTGEECKLSHQTFIDVVSHAFWDFYLSRGEPFTMKRIVSKIGYTLEYFDDPMICVQIGDNKGGQITQVNGPITSLYDLAFDIFHGFNQEIGGQEYDIEHDMALQILHEFNKQFQYDKLRDAGVDEDLHGVIDI